MSQPNAGFTPATLACLGPRPDESEGLRLSLADDHFRAAVRLRGYRPCARRHGAPHQPAGLGPRRQVREPCATGLREVPPAVACGQSREDVGQGRVWGRTARSDRRGGSARHARSVRIRCEPRPGETRQANMSSVRVISAQMLDSSTSATAGCSARISAAGALETMPSGPPCKPCRTRAIPRPPRRH
jgi:hypothetical protein